jgi:NADH:ubiquinone oxidoreductase subunit D
MPPKLLKNKYYMQNIPSVDLRDFLSTTQRKQKFVNEIEVHLKILL